MKNEDDRKENSVLAFFKKAGQELVNHPRALISGISMGVAWGISLAVIGAEKTAEMQQYLPLLFGIATPLFGNAAYVTHRMLEAPANRKLYPLIDATAKIADVGLTAGQMFLGELALKAMVTNDIALADTVIGTASLLTALQIGAQFLTTFDKEETGVSDTKTTAHKKPELV